MGRLLLLAALGACGNVASLRQDAAIDAPDPDALTCTNGELACLGQCSDPMTTHDHCGDCDIACSDSEDCVAGHCADTTASCFTIQYYNASATDGPYTHKADGTQFYCDMTHMMQYDELAFAQFSVAHTGYTQVGAADLQDPVIQQAFIWLYNFQGGADNIVLNWAGAGCCALRGTSGANMDLHLNGLYVGPALAGSNTYFCNPTYPDPKYRFTEGATTFPPTTLPPDFFTSNPATESSQCTDAGNPAFFWKRHP